MSKNTVLSNEDNQHFKDNIEASRYILAGAPEISVDIMSKFSNEQMLVIRTNCKLLLKKSSRMSTDQLLCLRSKIAIIDVLLTNETKK